MSPVALVTGFGPFLDVTDNPSAALAQALDGRLVHGCEVVGRTLPVHFDEGPAALRDLVATHRPRYVVATGVARSSGLRFECRARNVIASDSPDVAGQVRQGRAVVPGGPAERRSTLPLTAWAAEISDALGTAIAVSDDAGGYLCEATTYTALELAPGAALFVHLPNALDDRAIAAAVGVVEEVLRRLVQRDRGAVA